MSASRFASLLFEHMGLDVASIGPEAVARAVAERQRVWQDADLEAYWSRVSSSPTEQQALIEAVVVPETWFFRDPETFAALARIALRPGLRHQPLRVLSVPSSTGEEPYSMAMTLLDAGIARGGFQIDAVDISELALERARRGVYGKGAFRGGDLRFRDRYFTASPAGHVLTDDVRRLVRFRQGNVLAPDFAATGRPYDVIFCRNLFIYFDRDTQRRATDALVRQLSPDGVLFVTAAEAGALMGAPSLRTSQLAAGAFTKVRSSERPPSHPRLASRRVVRMPGSPALPRVPALALPPSAEPRHQDTDVSPLDEAMSLADRGQFEDAGRCCEAYMQRHGPSAAALHLLGLVCDASGRRRDAETYYRKALYLEPQHEASLVHLALLMDAAHNDAEAERLRARARRVVGTRA